MRGYPETGESLPHGLGFGTTLLCMGTARKFWVAPISFQRQWVFLPVWPESLLALILPGRLLPTAPLTEIQAWEPNIKFGLVTTFPY